MNWMDYFGNFQSNYIKKTMFELMKERYHQNEMIIERIAASLTTENDIKGFFKMVTDIYEMGYLKSVGDHQEQLKKLGLIANIVAEKK